MRARETKGEKTKRRLVEIAISSFARSGFHETSFQDIADEAGISQSAALYHFKSKLGLVEDAIQFITAQNHAYVSNYVTPRDSGLSRIEKYLIGNLEWVHDFRAHAQVLILLYSYAYTHDRFREIHEHYEDITLDRIAEHLYAAERESQLREGVDVNELTRALYTVKLGVFIHGIRHRSKSETVESFMGAFRSILSNYRSQ